MVCQSHYLSEAFVRTKYRHGPPPQRCRDIREGIFFCEWGGIFDSTPKDAPGAKFRESIELGAFDGGSSELLSAISGETFPHPILRTLRLLRHK